MTWPLSAAAPPGCRSTNLRIEYLFGFSSAPIPATSPEAITVAGLPDWKAPQSLKFCVNKDKDMLISAASRTRSAAAAMRLTCRLGPSPTAVQGRTVVGMPGPTTTPFRAPLPPAAARTGRQRCLSGAAGAAEGGLMQVEVERGVATLTLSDQKKRNALSSQVAHGFCARHACALVRTLHVQRQRACTRTHLRPRSCARLPPEFRHGSAIFASRRRGGHFAPRSLMLQSCR